MYIDPNTGGMLFQILAVLFAALSGIVLVFSSRIKMFIARLRRLVRNTGTAQEDTITHSDLDQSP